MVDHAHHAPGRPTFQQLQHIGQSQQQVAHGEKVHAHRLAVQALADEQKHHGKAQQVCAQHANENGCNHGDGKNVDRGAARQHHSCAAPHHRPRSHAANDARSPRAFVTERVSVMTYTWIASPAGAAKGDGSAQGLELEPRPRGWPPEHTDLALIPPLHNPRPRPLPPVSRAEACKPYPHAARRAPRTRPRVHNSATTASLIT